MPSAIDIVATPADGWHGTERADNERRANDAAGRRADLAAVTGYRGVADLVAKIQAVLQATPGDPCLRTLEIDAHGNPVVINDYQIGQTAAWAQALKALPWCDQAVIYLGGCNTGVKIGTGASARGSIAESLAHAMPFTAGGFEVRLTVYGSCGFLSGNWATSSNLRTSLVYRGKHNGKKVTWGPYTGAREATGADVWNAFRNW